MMTHRRTWLLAGALLTASGALASLCLLQGGFEEQAQVPPPSDANAETAVPVRLFIPRLALDAPIEQVGVTQQGNMDVPSQADTVGWYKLGARPGEEGNAVLSGHLDTVLGAPAVFWRLNELQPGDTITIRDSHAALRTFTVLRTETYDVRNAPLKDIFGPASDKNLQLITCNGAWLHRERSYDKRLVVYARLTDPPQP